MSIGSAQAGFHAGDALGKPEALLKILQAEAISTVNEDFDCAQVPLRASDRSQVAGADGISQRQVAVVLETVIATYMALQKWNARAAIERWAARADCESVLPVTATKSQYSAWRKSQAGAAVVSQTQSSQNGKMAVIDSRLRWN